MRPEEFLPVLVDERTGLTEEHIARVRDWALITPQKSSI